MSGAAFVRVFPRWNTDDARAQLRARWGIVGTHVERLDTERDDTFRITAPQGQLVLKASNPDDPPAASEVPIQVLRLLEREHPELPVERIVPTAHGATSASVAGRVVRVTSFLHGESLVAARRGDRELLAYGAQLAALHHAVAAIDLDPRTTPWNLLALDDYAEVAPALAAEIAPQVQRVVDDARTETLPALQALPAVLAHNDFHGDNLLVDPERPERIVGILDFGDLTRTPRVAECAVAASYARGYAAAETSPWSPAAVFVAGYRDGLAALGAPPLSDVEERLLPRLVLLRLAQRALLNSAALRGRDNPYASRNLARLGVDLAELSAEPPTVLRDPR